MENCLVLKCGGVVDNDSLLKVGEFVIKQVKITSPDMYTQGLFFMGADINVKIVGDGYFTDSSLTQNLGKELKNVQGSNIYVSNSDCDIVVSSKYNITSILFRGDNNSWFNSKTILNKTMDLSSLKYSKQLAIVAVNSYSNLSELKELSNLIQVITPNVTGDISYLSNNTSLTSITLGNKVTGDITEVLKNNTNISGIIISSPNIYGSFNDLDLQYLSSLFIGNTGISGDLSKCRFKNLRQVILSSNFTGDISTLNNCSNLSTFNASESKISGDIAGLSNKLISFRASSVDSTFTWSNRDTSNSIISLYIPNPVFDNIDKMLQDQSKCTGSMNLTDKNITVKGTRTSASDEAVQILQSKGYTITIIPA